MRTNHQLKIEKKEKENRNKRKEKKRKPLVSVGNTNRD